MIEEIKNFLTETTKNSNHIYCRLRPLSTELVEDLAEILGMVTFVGKKNSGYKFKNLITEITLLCFATSKTLLRLLKLPEKGSVSLSLNSKDMGTSSCIIVLCIGRGGFADFETNPHTFDWQLELA
jgi:hypothetical protein